MTPPRTAAVLRTTNLLLFLLCLHLLKMYGGRLIDLNVPTGAIALYLLAGAAFFGLRCAGAKLEAAALGGDILLIAWTCVWTRTGDSQLPLALYLPAVIAALRLPPRPAAAAAALAGGGMIAALHFAAVPAAAWVMRLAPLALLAAAAVLLAGAQGDGGEPRRTARERTRGMIFNEFINHILFQVREYLTSITTTSEHLARTAQEPEVRNLGGKLQRMIVELNGKVGRMLSTVKSYSTGRRPVSAAEFELASLLRESLGDARDATAAAKAKTRLWCDPGIGPLAWERDLLDTVFTAVFTNACEAIAPLDDKGLLNVSARLENDTVRVEIVDNGGGIPDAALDQAFLPLFTTKGKKGNLGLGLSMSRRMLERSGGTIKIKREGDRTLVSVIVPLRPTLPIIRTAESTWSGRRQGI